MEKYLKISLIMLLISLLISVCYVKAYPSPGAYSFSSIDLPANQEHFKSDNRTKINEVSQQYYHSGSVTNWSGDCDNCQVATQLYDLKLGYCTMVITTKKKLATFRNSELPGDYYIEMYRFNPGLINTKHVGIWYININR